MWWGGEDEEPLSGGSSSDNTTPPIDIMAEEEASFREDPSSSTSVMSEDVSDLPDLKDQFAMQESLLGHLKNVLRSNEEKLQAKEKEVQDYAIRLSKSKRSKMSSPMMRSADSVLTSSPLFTPHFEASRPGGKLSLLKKQLEEQRVIENEEIQSRQGLEFMVKQLQKELEERDNLISQLHEQMSVASFQTSPIHSPYVMSPGIGSPSGDRSPDRTPPLGCSVDSAASGFFASHYKSFSDKDNKIIELTEKNIELERKLLDIEENLRAKEELIRAKTAAVTLMSADLSAKGKSTLDQLEDTRTEMRKMQVNFSEQEAQWREKTSCLQVELESKDKRLQSLEESLNRTEKVRFELVTKNAELQEKVVSLQSTLSDLKARREEEKIASHQLEEKLTEKVTALERIVEIAERTRNDRKEEFVESIKSITDDEQLAEKIVELENKLTELEEEKGNLQLRLVDYEDISTSDASTKSDLHDAQEKLTQCEIELSETKHDMEAVLRENEGLTQAVSDRDQELENMTAKMENMLTTNEELSLSKVKLEMKAVELEEQKDRLDEERKELIDNITQTRKHSEETVKTLIELQKAHAALNSKMEALEAEHGKCRSSQRLHDEDLLEKAETIKELRISLNQLEKVLHDKNVEMSDFVVASEQNKAEKSAAAAEMQRLNEVVQAREDKIAELTDLLEESKVQEHIGALNSKLQTLQRKLEDSTQQIAVLEQELGDSKENCDTLNAKLLEFEQKEETLKATLDNLNKKLADLERELSEVRNQKDESDLKCRNLEEINETLNAETASNTDQVNELAAQLNAQKDLLAQRNEKVQLMEAEIASLREECSKISQEFIELTKEMAEMEAKTSLLESEKEAFEASKNATEELSNSKVQMLEKRQDELQLENGNLISKLEQLHASEGEWTSKVLSLKEECDQLRSEKLQLENVVSDQVTQIIAASEKSAVLDNEKASLEEKCAALAASIGSQSSQEQLDETLKFNIGILEKQCDSVKSEKSALEADLSDSRLKVEQLECKLAALEEELQALQMNRKPAVEEGEGWDSQAISLCEECESTRNEKMQLENLLSDRDAKLESLQSQLAHSEESLAALQEAHESLKDHQLQQSEATHGWDSQDVNPDCEECSKLGILKSQLELEHAQQRVQLEQLQAQLVSSEENMKALQEHYDALKTLMASKDSPVSASAGSEKLKAKCDLLTDKCKKLLAKCKQQEATIKELQASKEEIHKETVVQESESSQSTDEKHERLELLSTQLQDMERQFEESIRQVTFLQNELYSSQEQISSLSEQLASKEEELQSAKLKSEDDGWDSQAVTFCEECEKATGEKAQLQQQISEQATRIDQLQSLLDSSEEKMRSLRREEVKSPVPADYEKVKTKCDLLTEKCKKLLAKCKQQEATIKAIEGHTGQPSDEGRLTETIKMLETQVSDLKSQLDTSIRDTTEDQLKETTLQIASLQGELDSSNKVIATLREKLSAQDTREHELNAVILSLRSDAEQYTQELVKQKTSYEAKWNALESSVSVLKQENEANCALLNEQSEMLLGKSELVQSQEREILSLQDRFNAVISELNSARKETEELRVAMEHLESEKLALERDTSQKEDLVLLTSESSSKIERLEAKVEELQQERLNLLSVVERLHLSEEQWAEKLAALQETCDEARSEKMSVESEMAEQSLKAESLQFQLASSEENLKALQQTYDTILKCQEATADYDTIKSKCYQQEDMINELNSQISQTMSEHQNEHEQRLKLQDQLDSLTIVAENLRSLQDQVHLKDVEIETLRNELESAREQIQQQQALQGEAAGNRPPPDVTQYQLNPSQPDIATFQASQQPDLMPGVGFQASPFDLVQDQNNQGDWDNDWRDDGGNAANWFDNMQPLQDVDQPVEVQPENDADLQEVADLQRALEAKESECAALITEVDALVSAKSSLEAKIQDLKSDKESMQEKMAELESSLTYITSQQQQQQQNQGVQSQPDTAEKTTETSVALPPLDMPTHNVSEQEMALSPPPNVFTWDNFIEPSAEAQHASDFFMQQVESAPQFDAFQVQQQEIDPNDQIKELEQKLKALEDEHSKCHAERQQQAFNVGEEIAKFQEQVQALQYEKAMLEEQINQLPTMDAFNSLHKVNEELSEETALLKEKLEDCGEYSALKATNEELKMKLASIAESQNETYETRVQELNNQIGQLTQQLLDLQGNFDRVSSELEEQLVKIKPSTNDDMSQAPPMFLVEEAQPSSDDAFLAAPPQEVAKADNFLGAQEGPVEKGFSASSYFDQFGSSQFEAAVASPSADVSVFDTIDQEATVQPIAASVFDSFGVSAAQPSVTENNQAVPQSDVGDVNESIEWYKAQLGQYQQAITDWQTWSETQLQEVTTLKESVAYYTDAYNALTEEHGKCGASNEVTSLRAAVKAKDIEVQDLTETVDRLQAEKSELEQEITDLSSTNQELKRERDERAPPSDSFDLALYEETRQTLEDNTSKLHRASEELATKAKKLLEVSREKEEAEERLSIAEGQLARLQLDLTELKKELEAVKERKDKEINELTESSESMADKIAELSSELSETRQMLEDAQSSLAARSSEVDPTISAGPESTNVENEDVARLQAELDQQKAVLEDWNAWGQQKTEEYNALLEAYNQYVESYNALNEEIAQLKTDNENLSQKVSALEKALEEKEAELAMKTAEVVQSSAIEAPHADVISVAFETDKGWGMEEDVLQGQGLPGSTDNAVLELEAEISELKTKLRVEHDEKAKLNEEITAAKVKHGKLTLKVKQLTKELQSRKSSSPASSAATGDDSLDKAIMDEMNERAQKAEKALKDAQQLVKDLNQEKAKLVERVDTLEGGNERFIELKEAQDQQVQHLKQVQQDLLGKVGGFEWQLSEKDEQISDLMQQLSLVTEQMTASGNGDLADQMELRSELTTLRRNLSEMESSCSMLTRRVEELETALLRAKSEKEDIASQLIDAQDKYDSMVEEYELLRNVSSQFEALQAKLELVEANKSQFQSESAPMVDYENFHSLNQTMQQEILSLRAYIEQQSIMIEELQRRLQSAGEADQDQQALASLLYERNRVRQLEKDLQNKDSALHNVLRELEMARRGPFSDTRDRHESQSSVDRDAEVRKLFTEADTDLVMQNERLKYDLDKSVGERRLLSQQMENWKRQLTESEDLQNEEDDEENTAIIKMKQEQAYRSVGALQLRVEELTLEVTKLLEERDTLQLKLSNVMRQYERHKESTSRASTACSTPIPWVENTVEVKELKLKIEELSKLNYSLDIELQKERGSREQMQAKLRLHSTPKRAVQPRRPSGDRTDSPVLHI